MRYSEHYLQAVKGMLDLALVVESTTVPGSGNLRTPHLDPQVWVHYQQPGCSDGILRIELMASQPF